MSPPKASPPGASPPGASPPLGNGSSAWEKGRAAEDAAADWLEARGWSLVARNWRRGRGELDIVALRDGILAFVEVKAVDGYGLEGLGRSVGATKRRRLLETAKLFVSAHREFSSAALRFDVAAVEAGALAYYFEDAFAERS